MPIRKIIKTEKEASSYMLEIIDDIHKNGPTNAINLEMLAYIKHFYPSIFKQKENLLLLEMGLFYKPSTTLTLKEKLYSIFAEVIKEKTNKNYTPVQYSMDTKIKNNKFFSFSAPTSSGKSFLFMQLIKSCQKDIVIVVPSRALIAEYTHKILNIVKENKEILVLQFIENINIKHTKRRIFIVTPERVKELFAYHADFDIEMFLFDEAQISEEPIRGMKFDTFVQRAEKIFPNAKKIFAHPFISNPEAQLYRNKLTENCLQSKVYNQYSVGKIYMSFIPELNTFFYAPPQGMRRTLLHRATTFDPITHILSNNGAVLIYTSKSGIYSHDYLKKYRKYIDMCPKLENPEALDLINQLKEYIGSNNKEKLSKLIEMMEKGIVIHHGSIPLKGRLLIEKFVNNGYAKICFSTSTLLQGINMPFDAVWIDYYRFGDSDKDILALKNLVGRAGRSNTENEFNYGFVIINDSSRRSFFKRIRQNVFISEKSLLETTDINTIDEDLQDIVEAVINNTFDDTLQITQKQKERLEKPDIIPHIEFVLEKLIKENNEAITAEEYYDIESSERQKLKDAFKEIYCKHLRRNSLETNEERILSASLPILLWRIQGRSFKQIVANRFLYIIRNKETSTLKKQLENNEITLEKYNETINKMELIKTPQAQTIPNKSVGYFPLYGFKAKLSDFDYDLLVYDTYDYIDKVISLSLSNPISAAFKIYYEQTKKQKALALSNYVRYGTNDTQEILLLKYGFNFEDIEWLKDYITKIDENEIVFNNKISDLEPLKYEVIQRYIY